MRHARYIGWALLPCLAVQLLGFVHGLGRLPVSALLWFLFGLGIMVLELVQPGFIVIFFGIGAWVTALLVWLGVLQSLNAQLLAFLASSNGIVGPPMVPLPTRLLMRVS